MRPRASQRQAQPMSGALAVISLNTEDVIMSNYDLSPFYRSTVGFDRLFSMLDRVAGGEQNAPTYPPYNIERTGENAYRITLAVAGFAEDELSVETRESTLTVRGSKETGAEGREARRALSGHRRSRLRAPLPACRPRRRDGRRKRERSAAHRPGARGSRGSEAAHHRDQQGRPRPSKRSERLQPRPPKTSSAQRRGNQGVPVGTPFFVYSNSAGGTMLTFGLSLASAGEPGARRRAGGANRGAQFGRLEDEPDPTCRVGAEAARRVRSACVSNRLA